MAVTPRQTADERREAVLDAAVHEFAQAGYHAASTTAIARRAGISQPYIYALFPNKKALFIGCQQRASDRIRDAFAAAGDPEIREPVAACFRETFDAIAKLIEGTPDDARAFVAMGMYLNIARALELPK